MSDTIKFDFSGIDKLVRMLSGKLPVARVGVLDSKDQRQGGSSNTNAKIGRKHEFGIGVPQRSFLRMPLSSNQMRNAVDKIEAGNALLEKMQSERSLAPLVAKIGVAGEATVLEAFQTGGFGQWKPSIMTRKKTKQTLVETQQLRNSISSEVITT